MAATPCNFKSGSNAWTISGPSNLTFQIIKEDDDPRPMVKIFVSGVEQQCVPAETKRIWYITKVRGVVTFNDVPDTNSIGSCGAPVFCLRYTGHESVLTLRLEQFGGTGGDYIIVGRDDFRDGYTMPLTDNKFVIHNNSNVNTNSVHVMIRESSTDVFDFVITHMSGLPTGSMPACGDTLPNPACAIAV